MRSIWWRSSGVHKSKATVRPGDWNLYGPLHETCFISSIWRIEFLTWPVDFWRILSPPDMVHTPTNILSVYSTPHFSFCRCVVIRIIISFECDHKMAAINRYVVYRWIDAVSSVTVSILDEELHSLYIWWDIDFRKCPLGAVLYHFVPVEGRFICWQYS